MDVSRKWNEPVESVRLVLDAVAGDRMATLRLPVGVRTGNRLASSSSSTHIPDNEEVVGKLFVWMNGAYMGCAASAAALRCL